VRITNAIADKQPSKAALLNKNKNVAIVVKVSTVEND